MSAHGVQSTKLLIYDHNWNDIDYPSFILRHTEKNECSVDEVDNVGGVAFHCYSDKAESHNPAKLVDGNTDKPEIYFTECTGWVLGFMLIVIFVCTCAKIMRQTCKITISGRGTLGGHPQV